MIPSSLIPDLRALRPDRPAEEVLLYARLIWRFTADHVREIEVHDSDDNTVHLLRDITDFDRCLRQLANAARRAESLRPAMMPAPIANSDAVGSQVSPSSDSLPSEGGAVRADEEEGADCADGKGPRSE
jgi:hypothetical protein